MSTAERLFDEAMQLPEEQREELVRRLVEATWEPLEKGWPSPPIEDEEFWTAELARRDAMPEEEDFTLEETLGRARKLIAEHGPLQR